MPRPSTSRLVLPWALAIPPPLCLAATAFFLWCLVGSLGIRIGIWLPEFRLLADAGEWQPRWPVLPWLLAVGGLALAYGRRRWGRLTPDQILGLGRRLQQLALLTTVLLVLRLGTLWPGLSAVFPYLTLLWSPHVTWALGAAFLLFPQAGIVPVVSVRRLALGLFLASGIAFSLWALYFCQMTMLHGDEAHYLRVTQSLLRDGDMDLSNNLGLEQVREYHVLDFQPHQAPGSPPGKIHSVHPIGLSALLAPAYWLGLQWWENPRLACSLAIAWCSTGVLTLAFLWLVRLGFKPWTALACTLVVGSTTPFFLYAPQLYPEIPALLVTLLGLLSLSHWQTPVPAPRSWGNREVYVLAGLEVLLFGLLFLHPRYLPLALFLGAGTGLQVWHSPQRRSLLRLLLPLAGAGFLALLVFNYAYSNDLFGPFLPGNAWESGALQLSTLFFSLPGHWLHSTTGLLNSSPVFLASLLGVILLALRRDRRIWGVLVFYLVTAGVNGLHPDWTFGFCPPARYLITALPVLLLGLALFLETYAGRLLPLGGLLFALVLSYDSIITAVTLPEYAFGGNHLEVRALQQYYPFGIHFFSRTSGAVPWSELAFWLLATAGLGVALLPQRPASWRWAGLGAASLLPFVWGQIGALGTDANASIAPYLLRLDSAGRVPQGVQIFDGNLQREYQMTTGRAADPAGFGAQAPPDPAGILKSYYAPLIQPGISSYWLTGLVAQNAPGEVAGHLVIGQRQTLPAISDWGIFRATPITRAGPAEAAAKTTFYADFTGLGYAFVEFAGAGALAFSGVQTRFLPVHLVLHRVEVRHFAGNQGDAASRRFGVRCDKLGKGAYVARFALQGTAAGTLFERQPDPVYLAVFADQNSPAGAPSLEAQATSWLEGYYPLKDPTPRSDRIRPMVENIQAPWWTAVPLIGAAAYELDFALNREQEVWLLFDYPGDAGLALAGITLYRQDGLTADTAD